MSRICVYSRTKIIVHVCGGCVWGQTWDEARDKSNKIASMLVIIEAG